MKKFVLAKYDVTSATCWRQSWRREIVFDGETVEEAKQKAREFAKPSTDFAGGCVGNEYSVASISEITEEEANEWRNKK